LNIELLIARMKKQFIDTLIRTGLYESMGPDRFFARMTYALGYAWSGLEPDHEATCPLRSANVPPETSERVAG
jgi:SulP family sulfate permease